MKNRNIMTLLVTISLVMLNVGPSKAADVTLAWDASPSGDVAGYRIYRSNVSGNYQYGVDSPNFVGDVGFQLRTFTDVGVPEGTWYYIGTAYDAAGNESLPSNECSTNIDLPPDPMGNFGCTVTP